MRWRILFEGRRGRLVLFPRLRSRGGEREDPGNLTIPMVEEDAVYFEQVRTVRLLQGAVDVGAVPNVAATPGEGVVTEGAAGPRVAGESDPVTVDTLRIMSMTNT